MGDVHAPGAIATGGSGLGAGGSYAGNDGGDVEMEVADEDHSSKVSHPGLAPLLVDICWYDVRSLNTMV